MVEANEKQKMQILLPPAAEVSQDELNGWVSGQSYLILNYGTDEEFEAAARTANLIVDQAEALAARDARIEQLEAEVKTALHREAETTARYDAKIDALEAEIARKDEALRECRRAVSGGREEPRRRVRDIVDLTLRKPAALGETK